MNKQIYIIDPVVVVDENGIVQPVDGIFDSFIGAIGKVGSGLAKGIGSVASKLGSVIKSPVIGKVLEGGIAIGGSLLLAKQGQKQQAAELRAAQQAQAQAAAQADAREVAAAAAAKSGMSTKTMLLYGGAAAVGLLGLYLLTRKRR